MIAKQVCKIDSNKQKFGIDRFSEGVDNKTLWHENKADRDI